MDISEIDRNDWFEENKLVSRAVCSVTDAPDRLSNSNTEPASGFWKDSVKGAIVDQRRTSND